MREILTYVQRDYVDTVNMKELSRSAIDGMLEKLDPCRPKIWKWLVLAWYLILMALV